MGFISVTHAPHWKSAVVNGESVDMNYYEGLISIQLPAGNSTVILSQGLTRSYYAGFGLTLFVTVALFVLVRQRRYAFGLLAAMNNRWHRLRDEATSANIKVD